MNGVLTLPCSEATVEADLAYMLQPSRIYIGDNVNVFCRGEIHVQLQIMIDILDIVI